MRVIAFDLCALPLFAIILLTTYIRKTTKGLSNQLFLLLAWISLAATGADLATELICDQPPLTDLQIRLGTLLNYLYFVLRDGTIVVYLFFLFAITRTSYRLHTRRAKLAVLAPYGALLLALMQNPLTHTVFRITPEEGYQRGPLILLLYAVSVGYALAGTGYLISCKRFLPMGKWLALLSMYLLSFLAIFAQLIYMELLVEMFSTAVAFLLVILLVLRPEEITDSMTGFPNWIAYQNELKKLIATKQRAQIMVVRFLNASEIRAYLGEERYLQHIQEICRETQRLCRQAKLSFELYFEHPGSVYVIIDNADYDLAAVLPEAFETVKAKTISIEETGARLIPRVCLIRYPQDLNRLEDLLHFGHEFYGLVPYDQKISQASQIVSTANFPIENHLDSILSRAITHKRFEVFYQPIYSVREGRFRSAEALIRLRDQEYGLVSPGLFIPAAESRGLILPIGEFVLESVFQFLAEQDLDALGLDFIEINLSVAQCLQRDLPDTFRRLAERYGVAPERVSLEITETTYDNVGGVIDSNLKALSEMGYSFALDDYGTGYSNMRRVFKLPLKIIKIDKSLVDEMDTPEGASIMRNTVRMMRELRKELVAEGVETKRARDQLADLGVDYIQGFYYSRPLPAPEFLDFLRRHQRGEAEEPFDAAGGPAENSQRDTAPSAGEPQQIPANK